MLNPTQSFEIHCADCGQWEEAMFDGEGSPLLICVGCYDKVAAA